MFWLYPKAIYHFHLGIKGKKSNPNKSSPNEAQLIGQQARELHDKLVAMSAAGNQDANAELEWLHWLCWGEIKKNIRQKAQSGELSDRLPPVWTLLEMGDFAASLLIRLPPSQIENLKKYAHDRWQLPALIHLCKREQNKYVHLANSIELGKNIQLNINPSRTNGDFLFSIAVHAILCVAHFEPDQKTKIRINLRWMRGHNPELRNATGDKFQDTAEDFLRSLGIFSRQNFAVWRPVFETFVIMRHGPIIERLKRLDIKFPKELVEALEEGTERQWFADHRSSKPNIRKKQEKFEKFVFDINWFYLKSHFDETPAFNSDFPEIREILNRRKRERGKWIELKDEILKRISKLAPTSKMVL